MQSGAPCDEFGKSFPSLAIAFVVLLCVEAFKFGERCLQCQQRLEISNIELALVLEGN